MSAPDSSSPSDVTDPFVQFVDGFPLPSQGFFPETFRQILRLSVRPGDVILSTFPKCGTTWTQYIIWGILNDGKPPPSLNLMLFRHFPFLELVGPEPFYALGSPRLAKFHLSYDMTPKCKGCRLIHIMRNPFDACVSMYSHLREIDASIMNLELPFDTFFETFMKGTCMWGDYFEHETSWWNNRSDPDVLFVTFEDLKRDPAGTVTRIAAFLGLGEKIRQDGGRLLNDVLRHTSFSYLKENCNLRLARSAEALAQMGADYPKFCLDEKHYMDDNLFKTISFFRKGQVGSSRETLSADQWRRLEEAVQTRVTDPELRKLMMDTGKR